MIHEFIENVLDNNIKYYAFLGIEHYRQILLKDSTSLTLKDLGQGSKSLKSKVITIKKLTKKVQSTPKKAQVLFKIVNYFQCTNILEIGTSLGITTAYLSNANKKATITTIEGDPDIFKLAQINFKKLGLKNIKIINSSFDEILPKVLKNKFDLIFFDGNHSKEATLKYFYWALENLHDEIIFVFDDIYWSSGMKSAWNVICSSPNVMLSLDLFSVGVVFFKNSRQKQHINLIHPCNFY
jgi:predicted O-methyltransferase YrrM